MTDDLTGLGPQGFERLCQALAICVLGAGADVFGAGPDGGREASFRGLQHYPSPGAPWTGYGVLQAKYKSVVRAMPSDVAWLRGQVKTELEAWADPGRRRVTDGQRPDYLILATNIPLSSVPGTGGKDRLDTLIRQFAPAVGLEDWRIWDAVQITALLDANPRVRRAFAALITPSDVLAKLHDRLDEPPVVSVVLGTAAISPGEPGNEAAFQEAYDIAGGSRRLGPALGKVADDGQGLVQHFVGGPGQEPAAICALYSRPAVSVGRTIWNALTAVGGPGGLAGPGYPIAAPAGQRSFGSGEAKTVPLDGGSWGAGRLVRAAGGDWTWEPQIRFDSNAFQYQDAWARRDGAMDLRLRVAANIPLAADLRIDNASRARMLAALEPAAINDYIRALAGHYGLKAAGWKWQETPEPVGHNNTRQGSYSAAIAGPRGQPALAGFVWLSVPDHYRNGLLAIVDLRFNFDAIRPGSDPTSASRIAADLKVEPGELTGFFAKAWQVATRVLPLAAAADPLAVPPAGPTHLEFYIQNERPEHTGSPRPRQTLEMIDLSAYGQPRASQLRDLAASIVVPLGLADTDIQRLATEALTRMTEDSGFTGAMTV